MRRITYDTAFPEALAVSAFIALQPLAVNAAPVDGSVTLNGQAVRISQVAAQLHDNAEGVVRMPLVLVFSDRPLPPGALDGAGAATAVQQLARAGQVRGLLLRIDPVRPNEASYILLDKADDPCAWMASIAESDRGVPVIAGMKLGASTVSGRLDRPPAAPGSTPVTLSYVLKFDAPLAREPAITADLAAPALQASPQYKLAAAYADAMAQGDAPALRRLSSAAMGEMTAAMFAAAGDAAAVERMKKGSVRAQAQLAKFKRLVERGPRAMLIVDTYEYLSFVKENGEWKLGS